MHWSNEIVASLSSERWSKRHSESITMYSIYYLFFSWAGWSTSRGIETPFCSAYLVAELFYGLFNFFFARALLVSLTNGLPRIVPQGPRTGTASKYPFSQRLLTKVPFYCVGMHLPSARNSVILLSSPYSWDRVLRGLLCSKTKCFNSHAMILVISPLQKKT